jgi:hypothetical protein
LRVTLHTPVFSHSKNSCDHSAILKCSSASQIVNKSHQTQASAENVVATMAQANHLQQTDSKSYILIQAMDNNGSNWRQYFIYTIVGIILVILTTTDEIPTMHKVIMHKTL